eukprot:4263937-Pyramimonas_sp.AAC.1
MQTAKPPETSPQSGREPWSVPTPGGSLLGLVKPAPRLRPPRNLLRKQRIGGACTEADRPRHPHNR